MLEVKGHSQTLVQVCGSTGNHMNVGRQTTSP